MIKKITTEKDLNLHDFRVTIGTIDKKDPQVIYVECGTYIMPLENRKSYTDEIHAIKKEYRDIVKKMVSNSDLFENNYICTIDIPIDRISSKRKTYINFQYTLKQVETIPFYELTKEHHLFIDSVLQQFKDVLISYNYSLSKGKK